MIYSCKSTAVQLQSHRDWNSTKKNWKNSLVRFKE